MRSKDDLYNGRVGSVFITNKDDDSSELIVVNATKAIEEGDSFVVNMKLSSSPFDKVTVTWNAEPVNGQVHSRVTKFKLHVGRERDELS